MAIREDNKKVQDNLNYKKDKEESQKDNGMQEAKLFPAGLPKDLSYEDAVKTFEMSLDRKPKSIDELLDFFKNRKLNKATSNTKTTA